MFGPQGLPTMQLMAAKAAAPTSSAALSLTTLAWQQCDGNS